jgi:hypothetical protein
MTFGHPQYWGDSPYDTRSLDFELNVEPAERSGPPLRRRSKAWRRALFVGTVLTAGAWFVVAHDPGSRGLVETATSLIDEVVAKVRDIASRTSQEEEAAADLAASRAETEPEGALALLPIAPPLEQQTPPVVEEAPPTESLGAAYSETPEPAEDPKDASPKRKRAIAAGLGPDLPNVLLTRLSKADLKNAAYAIKTALAKTADDARFSWPPKPSSQQALFEVRFVPGASSGCRRYIVTVTKDRWTSTSAALERCGDATVHARAG